MNLEKVILKNLVQNEEFARKVLPFLKNSYFNNNSERVLFEEINNFVLKYNNLPQFEAIEISLEKRTNIDEKTVKDAKSIVEEIRKNSDKSALDWLTVETEKFCQEKAIYNAISESLVIMDGKSKTKQKGAIPQLLEDALAVSFDTNVGLNYLEDSDRRYDYYHKKEKRVRFDLKKFNQITKNGFPPKTLNIFMAGVGVGKTLTMCHLASACISQGYDVLYISLEMSEEEIAKRVDANLLNISLDDIESIPKDAYDKRVASMRANVTGRLIIKEYPPASASAIHFKSLLNELKLKKSFKPQIIFVDYINLCTSSRISNDGANSYQFVKCVAEEIRGVAVEHNVPIVSATQVNRAGYGSSDIDMTNTAESFGLPATCDFMVALIVTEELAKLGQIMVKQLKNRYNSKTLKSFVIGLDDTRMRLYDVEEAAQTLATQNPVVAPQVPSFGNKFKKNNFSGIKV